MSMRLSETCAERIIVSSLEVWKFGSLEVWKFRGLEFAVKKAITVIGVEAEGLRGIRLEENKAEWVVADCEFWPTAGSGPPAGDDDASREGADGARPSAVSAGVPVASAADENGQSLDPSPEDRYAASRLAGATP